jgi:hypothetical protein
MNTKNKQDEKKNQRQKTRRVQGSNKRGQRHEHELPETRMTR